MDSGVVDINVDANRVIDYRIQCGGPTWEKSSNEPLRISTMNTSNAIGSDVSHHLIT